MIAHQEMSSKEGIDMNESMADKLKRKLNGKSVIAMLVFGAIILVFVFFGMPGQMGGGIGSVARVNDALISLADFQQEENRVEQYYKNLFGDQMDFGSQRQLLRQQALENLVRSELVSQAAARNGIMATDAEVRDFIVKDIPFFQDNGMFQREYYSRYLENTRMTPANFEGKVRKDIVNVRTRQMFETVSVPTAIELSKLQQAKAHKINVQFVKIDSAALEKSLGKEVYEADLKALEDALLAKDEGAVTAALKKMKLSWEETGMTDLSVDTFPKITSNVANEAIFELKKSEPLLARLVRDGNNKFVLKLKDSKLEPVANLESLSSEMLQKRRGDGMFEAWVNQFRDKSHVSMNQQVLSM